MITEKGVKSRKQSSYKKRRRLMKQESIIGRLFLIVLSVLLVGTCVIATSAEATNGDNLISIGPISRAMGGVGIAAPQDAISAVFSNPAAMCFGQFLCQRQKRE
jgi:hypothetical protein